MVSFGGLQNTYLLQNTLENVPASLEDAILH